MTDAIASPRHLPIGTPIPGGIGNALADGGGGVLHEPGSSGAAIRRMWQSLSQARSGLPMPTATGDLPAGIWQAGWGDVATRYAAGPRRVDLTAQLGRSLGVMATEGVEQVVVGGSYVGAKLEPGDVDLVVVPRRDGHAIAFERLRERIARVAPDVHAYRASAVVPNAPSLRGAVAGESFLEFFQHARSGAARGAVLLQPAEPPAGAAWSALDEGVGGALRGALSIVTRGRA